MQNKKHYGLKEIKKSGNTNYLNNKAKEKYNERLANIYIIKYKKNGDEKARQDLIKMCYPIIFTVLQKFGKKVNTTNKLFDNEDLFNEGILVIDKCIKLYDMKYKVKFITYIWTSLYRRFVRFTSENIMRQDNMFISLNQTNDEEDELDILEKPFYKKEVNANDINKIFEDNEHIISDVTGNLDYLQINILYLKMKNFDISEVCEILGIGISKYYKVLEGLKEKLKKEYK